MNINKRNLVLNNSMEENIRKNFIFLEEFSKKEVTLKIENEKDCFKFKLFFDIDGKDCICETRASNLRDGIFRLKNKSKKIIFSESRKFHNSESIRTIEVKEEKKYEFKYIHLNSIDKPIGEKDIKNFMIQNKVDIIMFENIDKSNCLCIMQRKKDEFYLYITNYSID